ncbi:MAG: hypothetical protein ACYDA2_09600 [Acidimicrobiales bacterium]
MRTRPHTRAVAVLAALAMGAAACSSSNTASTTTTTTKPLDTATAPADIAAAYTTLFSFTDKSVDTKVAVIQDGAAVRASLAQALASPLSASTSGSRVDSTTLLSGTDCTSVHLTSPCAKLVYDLIGSSGSVELPNQTGYAVYVDGKWLVAKVTICNLLGLFYSASGKTGSPPGC